MKNIDILLEIAEVFGIGRIKYAPGTFGSLATCIVAYPILILPFLYKFSIILILLIIGIFASTHAEKIREKKDPKSVVIDEVVGQLITLSFISSPSFFNICLGFILFRIFDILKPPPIKIIENKLPSGMGIMGDDVMAGVMGGVILRGLRPLLNLFN